ncbi:MAG: hypothetical protein II875_00405 [Clostridia bacterium]|nr:hypothetical protein [Clostridia bacterium]
MDRTAYVAGRYGLFRTPPEMVPAGKCDVSGNGRWRIWEFAGTKIDAPILGNGDLLSAFAWPARYMQFWLTTNDFWQMESNPNYEFFHDNAVAKRDPPVALGSPRPLGRVVFDVPEYEDAACEVRQEYLTADTKALFTARDGHVLRVNSWVAATENELIVEISSTKKCSLCYEFFFPNELGKGCDVGVDCMGDCEDDELLSGTFKGLIGGRPLQVKSEKNGLLSGYREFSDHVDVPTKCAFGARVLGASSNELTLEANVKYTFVAAVRSWAKTARPFEYARSRAKWITENDVITLRALHENWWKDFWSVSGVEFADETLMRAYCTSQYMMASVSRDPEYPPNILGISTFDRMAWNGNYKINYNHQTPYLGLLAAGHFEQADPHDAPYLSMMDVAREMGLRLLKHEGAYLPLGLGPKGMVSEALLLHMKSQGVHGALNMLMRWRLSMDRKYLLKVFPYLLSVADFWENDLVEEGGVLHIRGDGMHERTTRSVLNDGEPEDPTNTLGYLRCFFKEMQAAADFLGIATERIPAWQDVLTRLAPYKVGKISEIEDNPTLWNEGQLSLKDLLPGDVQNLPVYFNEAKGSAWSLHFPGNVMHIYPGGAIGLGSDEKELETARNTVRALSETERACRGLKADANAQVTAKGAWNATNLGCLFFVAAVRVGFDPDTILSELRRKLETNGLPNGFLRDNPHGIENLSTVPNTLQEMMLLSHEGILRFFRVWPRAAIPDARFFGLRAYGGFVVDAALKGGQTQRVEIESTYGGPLTFENPWPAPANVNGRILSGKTITVNTQKGEKLTIVRAE